jgi:transcriptional regulator with XRE-family HTH domain
MASSKWVDSRFGERLKAERERRRWTQPKMADLLSEKGIAPMHATTIAKIEAGSRSVRINEAVGIADLFEMSVDALLGRQEPDDTTFAFALVTLAGYVWDLNRQVVQAKQVAGDIADQLEDAGERFDSPHIEALQRVARDMEDQLEAAHAQARRIELITNQAIGAGEETQG